MCGSMVDIQSATAEIRRGKKERKKERKKKETTAVKYNGLTYTRVAIIKPVGYKMRNTGMHRITVRVLRVKVWG